MCRSVMNRIVYALFLFASVPFVGQDSFVLVTAPSKFQDVCSRHGLAPMAQLSTNSSKGIFLVSSFSPDPSISTDRDVQEFELNQKLNVPELSGTTNANLTQSTTSILDGLPGRTLLSYFGSVVPSNYVQQPAMSLIRLGEAQSATALTGKGVIVAVIDTGVDADHPALKDVLLKGFNFIANTNEASELIDLDPASAAALTQSSTSILDGQNLVQLNSSTGAILSQSTTSILDGPPAAFGHGTMTVGLVHLVAPNANIMPLKAFASDGSSDLFNILRAIYYAVDHGAKVISMSFEIPQSSAALQSAIQYAADQKVTLISAAGNDGQRILVYPAAFSAVIGVGATDNSDQKSSFTNFGTNSVDVAAPGEGVVTTYPGANYAAGWGTSFSAPIVAGEAALVLEANPRFSPTDVASAISRGASVQQMGHGRVDVYQALTNSGSSGTSGTSGSSGTSGKTPGGTGTTP